MVEVPKVITKYNMDWTWQFHSCPSWFLSCTHKNPWTQPTTIHRPLSCNTS